MSIGDSLIVLTVQWPATLDRNAATYRVPAYLIETRAIVAFGANRARLPIGPVERSR